VYVFPSLTGHASVVAEVIATDAAAAPIDWAEVAALFAAERSYWVATTGNEGHPQQRPVLAVYLEGRIYSTTSPAARKGRNLTRRPSASLAAHAPTMDIVIEGRVAWIDDPQRLQRVGYAYREKYGWPVTVTTDGAFTAPYAAPTAGLPPYLVYEISPAVAYAFGTSNNLGERSTRYRFEN
jgi:hypothetical protein